jgi:hypothetical protein
MTQTQYRGGRWIAALLIALPVLGFVLTAIKRVGGHSLPRIDALFVNAASEAVLQTQWSLAVLWLAWGTRWLALRGFMFCVVPILYVLQVMLTVTWPGGNLFDPGYFTAFVIVVWMIGIVLAAMAALTRIAGFRLQRFTSDELAGPTLPVSATDFRDYHFSLMAIFKWTTVVAVILAVLRLAIFYVHQRATSAESFEQLLTDPRTWVAWVIGAVIPIAMGWAVLTARRLRPRLLIAAVASAATVLNQYMFDTGLRWYILINTGAVAGVMAAALFVFRYAGYRLLWRCVRAEPALES